MFMIDLRLKGDDYDQNNKRGLNNHSQNGESQEDDGMGQMIAQPTRKQPRLTDYPPPQVDNT